MNNPDKTLVLYHLFNSKHWMNEHQEDIFLRIIKLVYDIDPVPISDDEYSLLHICLMTKLSELKSQKK
jgi:hypothetical protein